MNLSTISKSQRGGGSGENVIFTRWWKFHSPQIRLPQKVWSSKLFKIEEEVLVTMQISTKCWKYFFSSRKTASKCVNLSTISKSQRGWGFDGNVIFTKSWKFHSPQIRLPQKVWSSKKIQVPYRRKFWCQCNLYRIEKSCFPPVLVAMQILLSVGSSISPQKRLPQDVWTQFQHHKGEEVLVET